MWKNFKAALEKMQEGNPDLEYSFFEQKEMGEVKQPTNREILEKLEEMERQLKLIFDGHVLIGGEFRKIPS